MDFDWSLLTGHSAGLWLAEQCCGDRGTRHSQSSETSPSGILTSSSSPVHSSRLMIQSWKGRLGTMTWLKCRRWGGALLTPEVISRVESESVEKILISICLLHLVGMSCSQTDSLTLSHCRIFPRWKTWDLWWHAFLKRFINIHPWDEKLWGPDLGWGLLINSGQKVIWKVWDYCGPPILSKINLLFSRHILESRFWRNFSGARHGIFSKGQQTTKSIWMRV